MKKYENYRTTLFEYNLWVLYQQLKPVLKYGSHQEPGERVPSFSIFFGVAQKR